MRVGHPNQVIVTDWRKGDECGVAIEADDLHVALFLTPTQARQTARKLVREADKADGQRTSSRYVLGQQNRTRTVEPLA